MEECLEFAEATAEFRELRAESLALLVGVLTVENLEDALGVAVEGLAGEALLVSSLGDGAVGSVEDGGGIGDTEFGR